METTWESRHCSKYITERNYKMYCEAKREIGEEPLDFEAWLEMENDLKGL